MYEVTAKVTNGKAGTRNGQKCEYALSLPRINKHTKPCAKINAYYDYAAKTLRDLAKCRSRELKPLETAKIETSFEVKTQTEDVLCALVKLTQTCCGEVDTLWFADVWNIKDGLPLGALCTGRALGRLARRERIKKKLLTKDNCYIDNGVIMVFTQPYAPEEEIKTFAV